MALNYPLHNDEVRLSAVAAPAAFNLHPPDNDCREQNPSGITAENAQFHGQVAEQGFHSATYYPTYSFGHHSTHMTPSYPDQVHDMVPAEQTTWSSAFAASPRLDNPVTNLHGHQPYDFNIEQGSSTYAIPQHGQSSFNGYTNASYADFSSGRFQRPLPFNHTGPNSNPNDPSVRSVRPYSCSFGCGRSFARKGDMERHARTHGPPSFWCGCGKGFTRKDKLMEHRRTHQAH